MRDILKYFIQTEERTRGFLTHSCFGCISSRQYVSSESTRQLGTNMINLLANESPSHLIILFSKCILIASVLDIKVVNYWLLGYFL